MYGPEEVALGYFTSREPWADEASTSGSGEEAERFPTLVDLLLRHGGTTEFWRKRCSRWMTAQRSRNQSTWRNYGFG